MKKQKRIWISLLLSFILIIVLSGCSGGVGPKTAKINIAIVPNPVPYNSEDGRWWVKLIFSESNGIGVTLTSVRFDDYDQQEQLYWTLIMYEEDIIDWIGSNYLHAFSALSGWNYNISAQTKYMIVTVEGVDDNDNPIEATGRVNYLSEESITKYWGKLYNACDGTCFCSNWTLKFYIDNVYTATIKAGKNYSTAVTAGWHTFLVYHNQECLNAPGTSGEITSDGWDYIYGCEGGTYPRDIGYKSTGNDVISSYYGYIR